MKNQSTPQQSSKPKFSRYANQKAPAELPKAYTLDGRELKIRAVSMVDLEYARQAITEEYAARCTPPTFVTLTVGGTPIEHAITELTLEAENDEDETARRKSAWAEYMLACQERDSEISRVTLEIVFDGLDEQPSGDWIATRKSRHLPVPPDEMSDGEKLTYWKTAVLLKNNVQDILNVQAEIVTLSLAGTGVSRESIAAAMGTFLDSVPGSEG